MSDFVIQNGVLLAYTGTDTEVYVPHGVTEIVANCFGSEVEKIYLPETIEKLGEDSLGNAIIYSENIPCIRHYMFRARCKRPWDVHWYWYNEAFMREYDPLCKEESAIQERLQQIEELKKNDPKENRTMAISAALALVADALLWWLWPWLGDTVGGVCAAFSLPWLFAAALYVVVFALAWIGLTIVIGSVLSVFVMDTSYDKEQSELQQRLEQMKQNAHFQKMKRQVAHKNAELEKAICLPSSSGVSDAPTSNSDDDDPLPWTADHDNAKDM